MTPSGMSSVPSKLRGSNTTPAPTLLRKKVSSSPVAGRTAHENAQELGVELDPVESKGVEEGTQPFHYDKD